VLGAQAAGRAHERSVALFTPTTACPADITWDRAIDSADLGMLLSAWGTADARADLDGNGSVGSEDLGILLSAWGSCPQ
jgi:hypothetical protein